MTLCFCCFHPELAEYAICKQQCPVDYNYDSYSQFTLNATIVFNSGAECCNENLSDSIWMIKEIPSNNLIGEISGNNSEPITPPGIDISVKTSNDLTTNIARVNITSANSRFRIVHEIHPDIDGENGRMIAVTFNFNYTQGEKLNSDFSRCTNCKEHLKFQIKSIAYCGNK